MPAVAYSLTYFSIFYGARKTVGERWLKDALGIIRDANRNFLAVTFSYYVYLYLVFHSYGFDHSIAIYRTYNFRISSLILNPVFRLSCGYHD